jgi:hypothetical protein
MATNKWWIQQDSCEMLGQAPPPSRRRPLLISTAASPPAPPAPPRPPAAPPFPPPQLRPEHPDRLPHGDAHGHGRDDPPREAGRGALHQLDQQGAAVGAAPRRPPPLGLRVRLRALPRGEEEDRGGRDGRGRGALIVRSARAAEIAAARTGSGGLPAAPRREVPAGPCRSRRHWLVGFLTQRRASSLKPDAGSFFVSALVSAVRVDRARGPRTVQTLGVY